MIDGPSIEQQELYRAAFVHNCLLLIVRARARWMVWISTLKRNPRLPGCW